LCVPDDKKYNKPSLIGYAPSDLSRLIAENADLIAPDEGSEIEAAQEDQVLLFRRVVDKKSRRILAFGMWRLN